MLSQQSAGNLDQMRQTHGLGEAPDRLMTFDKINNFIHHLTNIIDQSNFRNITWPRFFNIQTKYTAK